MRFVVDVGGTKTLVARVNAQRQVVSQTQFPTDLQWKVFLEHLIREVRMMQTPDDSNIEALVLGVPGVIDRASRQLIACGNLSWNKAALCEPLEAALATKVIIENDAKLGAIGEARQVAGRGKRVVLYITISTGIGGGVTVDGHLDPALIDTEIGEILVPYEGTTISWEHLASGQAFVDKYGMLGRDVSDPEIWKDYAPKVALGLIDLAALVQPDIIVIGGSMGEHLPKYAAFLSTELLRLKEQLPTVKLPPVVSASDPTLAVIKGGIEVLCDLLDQG